MTAFGRRETIEHAERIERRKRQVPRRPERVVGIVMGALLMALVVWHAYDSISHSPATFPVGSCKPRTVQA